ncbi:MAG: cytochrome c, partial [Pseudorhodobacter sp.]
LGAIAKGEAPYDAAVATKAAANISAIASVLGMDQFPAGSEVDAAPDSFALPAIWANPDDFDLKVKSLNDASATMKNAAAKEGDAVKAAMATLGGACGSCHKAYRQPES